MSRRVSRLLLMKAVAAGMLLLVPAACRKDRPAPAPARASSEDALNPQAVTADPGFEQSIRGASMGELRDPRTLAPSQLQYGVAPTQNSDVVYQDNVIVMENGDKAIKARSSNGLVWTFDATAAHADEIQPGKILFATDQAAGEVLYVNRNGNDLSVVLGPVQITDIIKQGHFAVKQPLDLNSLVAVSAPDYPQKLPPAQASRLGGSRRKADEYAVHYWVVSPSGEWKPMPTVSARKAAAGSKSQPHLQPTVFTPDPRPRLLPPAQVNPRDFAQDFQPVLMQAPSLGSLSPPAIPPGVPPMTPPNLPPAPPADLNAQKNVTVSDFGMNPCTLSCGGIGLTLTHNGDDIKIIARAILRLNAPSLHFNLDIKDAKIITADVEISGAAGLLVSLEGGTTQNLKGNFDVTRALPMDLRIPIYGLPVPLAVIIQHSVSLRSGFSAKNTTMSATGEYTFGGSIWAGYKEGSWGAGAFDRVSTKTNLGGSLDGLSVGITWVAFSMSQKVMVGVGAFGFATGPYVQLIEETTALKSPTIAWSCKKATLKMMLYAGVGYSIPKPVTDAINFFLRIFTTKQIQGSGSLIKLNPPIDLISKTDEIPYACAEPKSK